MIRFAFIGVLIAVVALQEAVAQGARMVIPVRDKVGVYRNELRMLFEAPLFTVGTADRLQVISNSKRHLKVKDRQSREGWIENGQCAAASGNRLLTFDPALVEQYMDAKPTIHIIDTDGPEDAGIALDRSFRDALSENVDRETVSRVCGE